MTDPFPLHPRLATECAAVASLALCDLLLMKDARFPWLVLVPRRPDIVEIIDLAVADRTALFDEMVVASETLRTVTGCDKLNVAALGNEVRQLHVHVIARFIGDAAWPGPVWGSGSPIGYEAGVRDRLIDKIRDALPD